MQKNLNVNTINSTNSEGIYIGPLAHTAVNGYLKENFVSNQQYIMINHENIKVDNKLNFW